MSKTITHVDPTVAYSKTTFIPAEHTGWTLNNAEQALAEAYAAAREAGRTPVMVEIIVRVKP